MTAEEIYRIWAPAESIWSPWAIAVPFAQMVCTDDSTPPDLSAVEEAAGRFEPSSDLAMVVDLPGQLAIQFGLAMARRGFRPVPVLDGSPGPAVNVLGGAWMDEGTAAIKPPVTAVDMRQTLRWLCRGASLLRELPIAPLASPVFLLDAERMAAGQLVSERVFDNRWKTFPQDYPSAQFFKEQGIGRVILVQERTGQPQEDLSHVLLRWQIAGIRLQVYGTMAQGTPCELAVDRPSHFRALWQRALASLGLRRKAFPGFLNWPHGTGGG